MVRQLLAFAKGAAGAKIPLNVKHLVLELRNIIKSTFPKNIDLLIKLDENVPVILGDVTQLHQVLLNLCVNARDAMPQGGRLTLEVASVHVDDVYAAYQSDAKPGQYVKLTVNDTGTGIEPHDLNHIFEPFFTTKGPTKGTGLGLSTVLGIVKGHRGFIKVYSQLGKGSVFTVHLPVEKVVNNMMSIPKPPSNTVATEKRFSWWMTKLRFGKPDAQS
jgi:signal transduction histidine kinase